MSKCAITAVRGEQKHGAPRRGELECVVRSGEGDMRHLGTTCAMDPMHYVHAHARKHVCTHTHT